MKQFVIFLSVLSAAVLVNCSSDPASPGEANDEISAQLNAFDADISAVALEDPGDTPPADSPKVIRLRKMISRIDRLLHRVARFEENHPNEEARTLIRKGIRHINAAKKAYEEKKFRAAFRHAKEAKVCARKAIRILRAQHRAPADQPG